MEARFNNTATSAGAHVTTPTSDICPAEKPCTHIEPLATAATTLRTAHLGLPHARGMWPVRQCHPLVVARRRTTAWRAACRVWLPRSETARATSARRYTSCPPHTPRDCASTHAATRSAAGSQLALTRLVAAHTTVSVVGDAVAVAAAAVVAASQPVVASSSVKLWLVVVVGGSSRVSSSRRSSSSSRRRRSRSSRSRGAATIKPATCAADVVSDVDTTVWLLTVPPMSAPPSPQHQAAPPPPPPFLRRVMRAPRGCRGGGCGVGRISIVRM